MEIGFIGLGQMGAPMARNILASDYPLTAFDKSEDTVVALVDLGATQAKSVADAVRGMDIVITMLPNSEVVKNVVLAEDGVLANLGAEAVLVDMSSSHPVETRKLGERFKERDRRLIDAPVSGGVQRAESGSLAIMVGGAEEDIDHVEPVLQLIGSSITRTGSLASAHALKALNNLLSASGLLAAAEVLLIGKRFGLNPEVMIGALNSSSGMNNSTKNKYPNFILPRTFNSGFSLDLMVKDLSIALDLAKETNTPAPSSSIVKELATAAQATLEPGRDHTEAIRILEKMCGDLIGEGDDV